MPTLGSRHSRGRRRSGSGCPSSSASSPPPAFPGTGLDRRAARFPTQARRRARRSSARPSTARSAARQGRWDRRARPAARKASRQARDGSPSQKGALGPWWVDSRPWSRCGRRAGRGRLRVRAACGGHRPSSSSPRRCRARRREGTVARRSLRSRSTHVQTRRSRAAPPPAPRGRRLACASGVGYPSART